MFTTSNKTFECPKFSGHSELSCHSVHGSVIVMLRESNWDFETPTSMFLTLRLRCWFNPLTGTLRVRISMCFPQQVKINIVETVNNFMSDGEGGQSFPLKRCHLESPHVSRNVEVWSRRENEEMVNYCRHRCLSTVTIAENLQEFYKWNNSDT